MAEERTKPLTLAKTSLTKTKSVAVVLSVCALMFIGVLGLGSLYMTGKTSPYGGNTVGTALPSGSKGYQVPYGSVHLDASTFALDGSAVVADSTRLDITQLVKGQQGFASYPVDILTTAEFQTGWYTHSGPLSVTFDMYIGAAGYDTTGMALGADGLCMNLGAGPGLGALAGGAGEDGVNKGLSVCLDEYANSHHEHGFFIYYNGDEIYADASECDGDNSNSNNVECPPVSLFVTPGTSDDEVWHTVTVTIAPGGGGAQVSVDMDSGAYTASADIAAYALPSATYLSFSARTGGAINYHSVRNIRAL
jgi:hypothetical protein